MEQFEPDNIKPKTYSKIHKVSKIEGEYQVEEPLSPEHERLKEEIAKRVVELLKQEIHKLFT